MNLVSEELKKRDIERVELTRALGRSSQSVFNAWLDEKTELDIDDVIQICRFLKWRPAWGLFQEGPKSAPEDHELALIRNVIALLGDDVRRAVGPVPYVPEVHLKTEIRVIGKALAACLSETDVELPERFWNALESASTLLRQLDVPQVAICRTSQRLGESEQSRDDVGAGE
jgi:hypothetical protein